MRHGLRSSACGLDVGLLAQAQELPSNDSRNLHPHGQADGQEDLPEPLPKAKVIAKTMSRVGTDHMT